MKFSFLLVLVLSFNITVSSFPTDDLWNKTLQYISEKRVKSFGVKHLIFDENNYTGHDINSKEMNILYNYQERLYNKYSVSSFLFIYKYVYIGFKNVISIDIRIMLDHLKAFGVDIDNTVFLIISVNTTGSFIYIGNIIKEKGFSTACEEMLNDYVVKEVRNQDYYQALEKFLNYIESSYNFTNRHKNEESHTSKVLTIIIGLIFYIIFVIVVSILLWKKGEYCYEKCCSFISPKKNKGISFGGDNSIGGNSAASYRNNSIGGVSGGTI